jgi:hypothetical protein
MHLAIISDTTMPKGARRLPPECVPRLKSADLIVDAGRVIELNALRQLQT